MNELIEFSQNAVYNLEVKPGNTVEYVSSLSFLDSIQDEIEGREEQAEIVKKLYALIETYNVPTPPEDLAVYQTLYPSMSAVRNAIDKSLAERDANVDRFCTSLDKDIEELGKEVKEVKQEAQNPSILDAGSEPDKIAEILNRMQEKMTAFQERAFQYKTYQKNFKVEVKKFEELEEVHAEIKLKQLLWNSLQNWDKSIDDWLQHPLDELDADDLNVQVMKYVKSVLQLEKGLPPNNVVPILKEKVESMRAKMPTITDLRNPALKQRHWDQVWTILDHRLSGEEKLNLGLLMKLDAFDHAEEIQEVSSQASSEQSLEAMLRKVE